MIKFKWFLLVSIALTLVTHFVYHLSILHPADPQGYYAYLPMVFENHSLEVVDPYQFDTHRDFLTHPTFNLYQATGKYLDKYPPGVALLQSPSYFIFRVFSLDHPDLIISLLASVYLSLGLWFLYLTLKEITNKKTSLLVTTLTLFATNLFYYAFFDSLMSHVYSFAISSLFIYFSFLWQKKPNFKNSIKIGLLWGLAFLIKNQNGLIILFFLGLNLKTIFQHKKQLVYLALSFILTSLPQFIYHYAITGKIFVFSYLNESLNFINPSFYGVLLSPRKGLFFYTPIILLSLLPWIYKKRPKWLAPTIIYLSTQTYIIASWSEWWFGDSFGHRAFIDYLPFFALLIAFNLQTLLKKYSKLTYVLLFILVTLNLFLTHQYIEGNLTGDNTTLFKFISLFYRSKI